MTQTVGRKQVRRLTDEEYDIFTKARACAYSMAPMLAAALYTLNPVYVEGLGTWAMDDKARLYMSLEGWAGKWTEDERASVVLHEVWHYLRRHTERIMNAKGDHPEWVHLWNVAADMEINDDLLHTPSANDKHELKLPDGCVYPHTHKFEEELTAEEYAAMLEKIMPPPPPNGGGQGKGDDGSGGDQQGQGQGQNGGGSGGSQPCDGSCQPGGNGAPCDGSCGKDCSDGSGAGGDDEGSGGGMATGQNEDNGLGGCTSVPQDVQDAADAFAEPVGSGVREYVEQKVAQDIAEAAAKGIGNMPSSYTDWAADKLAPPKIRWEDKFRIAFTGQTVEATGRGKSTYSRISRRRQQSQFIFPGVQKFDPNLLIGVDKSGSMFCENELSYAISAAESIMRSRGVKSIKFMEVDVDASEVATKRGRTVGTLDTVGGGTDMREFFSAVGRMFPRERPTNAVLFTDGETAWPSEADIVPGVKFLAAIIADEVHYEHSARNLPSWIEPVHIPIDDLRAQMK